MNNHYHHLAFGPRTIERQQRRGSFTAYGSQTERPDDGPMVLDQREKQLITSRDEFQTGWTVGGGIEYALPTDSFLNFFRSSAVTIKVEGLYVNLERGNRNQGALVVNAPGSRGGVKDTVAVIGPLVPHVLEQLGGGDH